MKNVPTDLGNDAALTLSPIYGLAEIVRLLLNAGTDPSAEFPVPGVMKLLPAYSGKDVVIENVKAQLDLSVRSAAARSLLSLQNVSNTFISTGGSVGGYTQTLTRAVGQGPRLRGGRTRLQRTPHAGEWIPSTTLCSIRQGGMRYKCHMHPRSA